nr:hypothetical protein BDOA9_0115810 [Bradyrhizobium sp. DOA9]
MLPPRLSASAKPWKWPKVLMCWFVFATGAIALLPVPVAAQTAQPYSCDVVSIHKLGENGVLQSNSGGGAGGKIGDRFQVDIVSGDMIGPRPFRSKGWPKTSVIDPGTSPRGSSSKVLYSSLPDREFVNVGFLQIHGAIQDLRRPFFFDYGGLLYSGVCRPGLE